VLEYILRRNCIRSITANVSQGAHQLLPATRDNKEGWDNLDIFGCWLSDADQSGFLCRDSILAAPIVLDLVLFFDSTGARHAGIQEWPQLLTSITDDRARVVS